MVDNHRLGEAPVPANYKELLTLDQIQALQKLESFGWSLKYVRRPKFEPVEVILEHNDGGAHAVLRRDGELDTATRVGVRKEPEPAAAHLDSGERYLWSDETEEIEITLPPEPDATPVATKEPIPSARKESLPGKAEKTPPKFIV